MTAVTDTINLLKARGLWSDKQLMGKDYKPLPTYKKTKAKRQHLPI